jgi:hypothetical protein
MPITIKEIISSDSMSGVIEKVNFNFDQLILAGGGPPGIQGIQGEIGPVGPQGFRGDHWFAGPSAFGQTADHDGTSLRIQDHFLDSSGNVYEFYNIGGATGWTASGINLKGPQGIPGTAGGSLEWKYYLPATGGNPIDGQGYSPTPNVGFTNNEIDFLIPNETFKNSIFLGNQNWAYFNLKNFGTNISGARDTASVPKFTIIQNNVNPNGQNGVSFGGPLPEGGTSSGIYGNSGSTSAGGTNSAYSFVHAAFATEQDQSGGTFTTKWKVHSYQSNIKIQAGGATSGTAPYIVKPATIEIMAADVKISNYDRTKFVNIERDFFFNNGTGGSSDNLKEIIINSIPSIETLPGSSGAANTYGYVALQNQQGAGTSYTAGFPEHRSGSVIIGPTYNVSQGIPIATNNFQGLGIVRKITRFNTVDSAIKFFQDSVQIGNSNLKNAKFLTLAGSITPVRTTEDAANVSGNVGVVLDSLMINAGSYDINNSTVSTTGVTAYNGGRLGLSNNTRTINKPQFPIHISAIPDVATRKFMWDGDSAKPGDYITNWYAGFDSYEDTIASRNGGIAFGNTTWKDDYIYAGYGYTMSGMSFWQYTPAPVAFTNPVLKTYIRRDTDQTLPFFGANGGPTGMTAGPEILGQVQGYENPHIYVQPGKEDSTGNIGIGFVPGSTAYNVLGSIKLEQISYAKSKLAINGSITIGSTNSGYHKFYNNVPINGMLIGGLIVQGETRTQGLDTISWNGPSINSTFRNFSYTPDDYSYRLQIGFVTEKTIMAKQFLAKGMASSMYPDFALPDAKTGMGRMPGETSVGALFADRSNPAGATTVSNTTSPIVVAKWSSLGDGPSKNLIGGRPNVGGFTINNTFALLPKYYDINTLPWYAVNIIATYNGQSSTNTSAYHRIVYHEIPATSSTVFLDLTKPKTSLPIFGFSGSTTLQISSTPTYLSGQIAGGSVPINPLTNSQQFTIEDGYYEGQILRIMILDVDPRNYSVLVPNAITRYTSYYAIPSAISVSSIIRKDNIAMAAEKFNGLAAGGGVSWPLPSPGVNGTENAFTNQRPWPMPGNAKQAPLGITPATTAATTIGIDAAINNAINQYNIIQNQSWTSISYGAYDPDTTTGNGSHGVIASSFVQNGQATLGDMQGIGAFKITPWRSITLQWHGDDQSGAEDFGRGCWYEIARENLVSRKLRAYSGSGELSDIYSDDSNGQNLTPDFTMGTNLEYPSQRIAYSFYNPTGEGTMQILQGGSIVKQITQSESGFIAYANNFVVTISMNAVGGTDNSLEARCKVISTDIMTANTSTILKDVVVTTGGTAINLTTSPGINYGNKLAYSIEGSAIIKRNSI